MAIHRHLALAMAVNTLGLTAHTTYMYYLAPIMLRTAGVVGKDAVIFSLVAVAMGIAVVPSGRLADRIPRRNVMRLGLGALAISCATLFLTPSLATAVAGTLASGLGLAFLYVSFLSYIADILTEKERTGAYATAGALAVLATALGPFFAALALRAAPTDIEGLRWNGVVFTGASLVGIAITFALPSVRVPSHTPAERGRWYHAARAAGPVALLYVLMGAGYGMTAPYFTVYFLDQLHFANDAWGYVLAVGTLASAVGSILAGTISRRIPPTPVAILGMLGLLLSSLVFLFPRPIVALILGFTGRSFFSMTVAPGMNTVLMARANAGRRAEVQAYGSLAWNIGWAVGGAVGGTLLALLGGALFPIGGALAFVGVALGTFLLRARRILSVSPK